jgi:hypothetical protein
MNTTDEFLKAWNNLRPIPEPEIEYRFYYDDTGRITTCSQTNHQEYGDYLVVTKHEYQHYYQYYVENNKLKMIDINTGYRVQLKKSSSGYAVVKNHAGLIVELDEDYKDIEYYDNN